MPASPPRTSADMNVFLSLCFLFFVGSLLGWCAEVFFRRFVSAKKWINPGFLTGPYLPIYGFGLVGLYAICCIPVNTGSAAWDAVVTILIMGAAMTAIEFIGGLVFIRGMKIKLWDYSDRRGNICGIICPLFSAIWTAAGALYYFVIDPFVISWVEWFVNNIAFSFVVGIFFGIFFVDLAHAVNLSVRIRAFAKEHRLVVAYERLKVSIRTHLESVRAKMEREGKKFKKPSFLFAFRSDGGLEDSLAEYARRDVRRGNDGGGSGEDSAK